MGNLLVSRRLGGYCRVSILLTTSFPATLSHLSFSQFHSWTVDIFLPLSLYFALTPYAPYTHTAYVSGSYVRLV